MLRYRPLWDLALVSQSVSDCARVSRYAQPDEAKRHPSFIVVWVVCSLKWNSAGDATMDASESRLGTETGCDEVVPMLFP